MICPSCGSENEGGRKFCGECGSRLVVACPSCGSPNPPTAKFCGECATPLAQAQPAASAATERVAPAAPAAVAERRLVSVLFADLVGFTALSEGRDAEETRALLTSYFELARSVIGRYGGTVEKFIGDAVMAVWGAPVAREDDAERAVRAGLELVDAVRSLGPTIEARAGVLTGEAAVTIGATNEGLVAGDLVNTASRLQSVAPPGAVLVGAATKRATSRAIEFEEAGEQLLKGKSAPVPAWRAARVVAQIGGRNRSDTLEAPFVGRDIELRLLKDLFHATEVEGRARLVSVIGPAGIGKSRLAWEFLKYVDGLVDRVWWHDGRSPAYGDGISFWALGEMVRVRCGLLETDDEPTTRAKVDATLAEHVPDPDERRWIEGALLALLGIEASITGPEQLFGAWRTFFERLAATSPVVLVFEDFHFADAGLLDFVDHLLEWSRGAPIYVLTLSRPDLLERRPDWGAGKRSFTSLHLEPLPPAAMRALLDGLVPGLPGAAVAAIVERADGIPLYAVETVRMLLAEGKVALEDGRYVPTGELSRLAVPETLTALIASRLDALPADERTLLSDAAVLGQSFTVAGLAAVSAIAPEDLEPRLGSLARRELVRLEADARSPERGQYVFVQALIREVAYNTLARSERKRRHLAAARYFETLNSEEIVGALAAQYLAAHENATADDEAEALAAQARIALRAAADRAIGLGSPRQAMTFLDQARLVSRDRADTADLLERAGHAATNSGLLAAGEERLREAIAIRRELGEPDALAAAIATLGDSLIKGLRRNEARVMLETAAEELVGDAPVDGPGRVALLGSLCRAYFLVDENQRAVAVADRTLEAAERLDLVPIVSDVLITRGGALCMIGRSYEGLGVLRAGMELADEKGLVSTAVRGRINLGIAARDARVAFEVADGTVRMARRYGLGTALSTATGNLASAALHIGEWDRAIRELTAAAAESVDEFGANYAAWNLLTFRTFRGEEVSADRGRLKAWAKGFNESAAAGGVHQVDAEAAFAAGRFGEACDEWLEHARGDAVNAEESTLMAGLAAALAGRPDRARSAMEGLAAVPGRSRTHTADQRMLESAVAALEGRSVDALRDGRFAIGEFEALGLVWRQGLAGLALASALGVEAAEVRGYAEAAREIFARLAAAPFVERTDALLAEPGGAPSEGARLGEVESAARAAAG
ncbi:MAG TPA: adenylate/guanylate cyclase domain-containing protein [Candidatus Limnocylindrales bacterium]|nr:adenylate/guanylate cyclase domain-containing protein [Candidatus Limnocylindrales bacterium]